MEEAQKRCETMLNSLYVISECGMKLFPNTIKFNTEHFSVFLQANNLAFKLRREFIEEPNTLCCFKDILVKELILILNCLSIDDFKILATEIYNKCEETRAKLENAKDNFNMNYFSREFEEFATALVMIKVLSDIKKDGTNLF